ncbi:hypothetical protein CARUB_v10020196mg, partial [Capsella rubella]
SLPQTQNLIKHPYHPEHSLQCCFLFVISSNIYYCLSCGQEAKDLVYYCNICKVIMHTDCAMKPIPFIVDQPKSHDHPLTLFPRQASLTCNVCGLLRKHCPTYICIECTFVAHNDCIYAPHVIMISRHQHRIAYTPSLRLKNRSCGVCRQRIDCDYGAYTCDKCSNYAVHSRCALGKDVWDGTDLKVILHFLHEHHLQLDLSIIYDENKLCRGCVLPIFEGRYYSCRECEFFLHETCAKADRIVTHALHPHPLTLKIDCGYPTGFFFCNACYRFSGGFVYQCPIKECNFDLDIRCASISEPYDYKRHEHPLFLALDPKEKPLCHICKKSCYKQLNCIECDFIVCMECATLPYEARYKNDKHFLKVLCGEEVCDKDWCEVCECNLKDTKTNVFYWCNDCCTTLHIECLLGKDPYIKPGQFLKVYEKEVQIYKTYVSRPLCDNCKEPCQGKLLKRDNLTECSVNCVAKIFEGVHIGRRRTRGKPRSTVEKIK